MTNNKIRDFEKRDEKEKQKKTYCPIEICGQKVLFSLRVNIKFIKKEKTK